MVAESEYFHVHADVEPVPLTFLDRWLWPLLLLLAWLAFELTANATLSLVLACLKFGMNDFRTAWWLWQVDPQRPRARACAMFYGASGVWKTAIVPLFIAGSISIVWALVSPHAMQPARPVTVQLQKALFVGLWAAAGLIFLVTGAVVFSLFARWRVWVHPSLHRSRREKIWPPSFSPAAGDRSNQASLIMVTAIFALILIGPIATLQAISHLALPLGLRKILNLTIIFGYPIFSVLSLALLRSKLFADSPWECWPESIQQLDGKT